MSKFKVGDRLVWVGNDSDFYTPGKSYAVLAEPVAAACVYILEDDCGNRHSWNCDGIVEKFKPSGPVRTVTRREIVPGVYGEFEIFDDGSAILRDWSDAEACREASHLLAQIAEVLEDQEAT